MNGKISSVLLLSVALVFSSPAFAAGGGRPTGSKRLGEGYSAGVLTTALALGFGVAAGLGAALAGSAGGGSSTSSTTSTTSSTSTH